MNRALQIDAAMVSSLGTRLRTIATEFHHAQENADEIAAALGHETAAGTMRSFASDWDDRRGDIMETMVAVADAATAVGESFTTLDDDLAGAISEAVSGLAPAMRGLT